MSIPFPQSYWVHEGLLCAGHYPGDLTEAGRDAKLRGLLDCGIRQVLNLMEAGEASRGGAPFDPYEFRLAALAAERDVKVECLRLAIPDASVPDPAVLREILDTLDRALQSRTPIYLHCWGGHGRTSTVVACHLMERGHTADEAMEAIERWRRPLPKNHFPFEGDQVKFVRAWRGPDAHPPEVRR